MWDRTVINPTRVVETSRTIHEHRAPTDESVKLLMEMEQKALEKLLSITRLENNTLNAVWSTFQTFEDARFHIVCRYQLNGSANEIKFDFCGRPDPIEIASVVRTRLVDELSVYLTEELFRNAKTSLK